MTKEVADKIVRGITDKIECNTVDIDDWAEFWGFTREEYEEFLDVAIKALEQEDVLKKIKTEIEQLRIHKAEFITDNNKVCIDSQEVLNVIDKYIEGSDSEC